MDAATGVELGRLGVSKNNTRGPQRGGGQAGLDDPIAHGACGLVACAAHHRRPGAQAGEYGGLGSDLPRDFDRFVGTRQELGVQIKRRQHLVRPAAVGHIKKQSA